MTTVTVPGFLPSTRGLHFENFFPHEPTDTVDLPGGRKLAIGDAANGLCGGMAYTVRDYYEAGQPPPADTTAPAEGTPLFTYLVQRLMASFTLPLGIGRYIELMNPAVPDHETWVTSHDLAVRSRAYVMVQQEWPKIRADIDAGHPVPLGLIKVKSLDVMDLGKNHQVLAYGYDLVGTDLSLRIYDPNYADNDNVTLSLSVADPAQPTPVTYSPPETVYCFFRTAYTPCAPNVG